jgi:hypothetical protein
VLQRAITPLTPVFSTTCSLSPVSTGIHLRRAWLNHDCRMARNSSLQVSFLQVSFLQVSSLQDG